MDTKTAILFGAFAAKNFNLPQSFDVLLVDKDWRQVRVVIPDDFKYENIPDRAEYENVELKLYVHDDSGQRIETWAAYAERARTLVVASE